MNERHTPTERERRALAWNFKTAGTWTAKIGKKEITYYPFSREWVFDGEKLGGDIVAFVRSERESPRLLAETFAFFPADKQAAVIMDIMNIARSWNGGRGESQWWSIYEYLPSDGKTFIRMMMALFVRKRHFKSAQGKDADKAKHLASLSQNTGDNYAGYHQKKSFHTRETARD